MMITYAIIALIAVLAAVSIRKIIKDRMLSRCTGCSGDCSSCDIYKEVNGK